MSNRTLSYLIALGTFSLIILFVLNTVVVNWAPGQDKYFSPNNVKGIDVYARGKPYPLNFEQQNQIVLAINNTVPIGLEGHFESEDVPFDYEKLLIHRFKGISIELIPVGMIEQHLLLKAPLLNPKGFIRETGAGNLYGLINQTFDK